MKRQGFTLIELLAVIVVLAIIALIATPIVMNTIESSKKGATIESVRNIVHAAELYFISENPRYGKLNLLDDKLDYDRQKPELGEIEVNKDGDSRVYAYINGYCVTKEYDSELYASKTNKEECNWYATDNYETTEGTTFTLNNQKIKNYLIYGNSTQDKISGKNLFDYSYLNSTYSINGLKMTSTDDVITINGTLNKQGNLVLSNDFPNKFDTSKTYTLKIHVIGGNAVIGEGTGITFAFALFNSTNTKFVRTDVNSTSLDNIASVTFSGSTFEGDENLHLLFQNWRLESTYNNYQVKIQIEEGSTATEYEEYGMMPSPEFPSEIKNTGDLLTKDNCASYGSDACDNIGKYVVQVKATGKNLFDLSALNWVSANGNNIKYSFNNNSVNIERLAENNTSAIYATMTFKPGVYTISLSNIPSDYKGIGNFVYSSIFGAVYKEDENGIIKKTFTLTEPKTDVVYFYMPETEHKIGNKITYNVQIEEGTSATTYEPYREATTNIYLDEPLRKVDNTSDYIDFANNKVVRYIKNIDLSKCTIGLYTYKNLKGIHIINALDETKSRVSGLSNREDKIGKYYDSTGHYMWIGVNNTAAYWVGILDYLGISTVTEFQQWIKANQVSIYYALTTPIEETIDLPNIELLDGTSTLLVNTSTKPSNVKLTTTK